MYFFFSWNCRSVSGSPIPQVFFNTWGSLASELNMHKANQFILSFPYGSQKEQDIPLYSSTVGSLPLFLFFFPVFPFSALAVFLKGVIPLFPEQDSLFHGREQAQLRGVRTFGDKGSVHAVLMVEYCLESWILKGWEPLQLHHS